MQPARSRLSPLWVILLLSLALLPATAHAHSTEGQATGFSSGFLHPFTGADHLAALLALGLWTACLGPRAAWVLPVVFPMVTAFGGALGVLGLPLPGVEAGIALSAVILGLMVALGARPRLWIVAALSGCFALLHGHAHGAALAQAADPVTYAVGFVTATGLLQLAGLALGSLARWPWGRTAVRGFGAVIACVGAAFFVGPAPWLSGGMVVAGASETILSFGSGSFNFWINRGVNPGLFAEGIHCRWGEFPLAGEKCLVATEGPTLTATFAPGTSREHRLFQIPFAITGSRRHHVNLGWSKNRLKVHLDAKLLAEVALPHPLDDARRSSVA